MNIKKLKSIFAKLEDIKTTLEEIHDKAETTYENRSAKWQEGDEGQTEYERIINLESAIGDIANALENFDNAFSFSWHLAEHNLGGWAEWGEAGRKSAYPLLCEPDGRLYLAGEHLSYLGGWQAGAIESAWAQIAKIHARVQQA